MSDLTGIEQVELCLRADLEQAEQQCRDATPENRSAARRQFRDILQKFSLLVLHGVSPRGGLIDREASSGRSAAAQRSRTKTTLNRRGPNCLNIGVAGLSPVRTFPADEQMPLQGVQFWSFLYLPQAVAFEVAVGEVPGHLKHYVRVEDSA
jgi:hypothetical protein